MGWLFILHSKMVVVLESHVQWINTHVHIWVLIHLSLFVLIWRIHHILLLVRKVELALRSVVLGVHVLPLLLIPYCHLLLLLGRHPLVGKTLRMCSPLHLIRWHWSTLCLGLPWLNLLLVGLGHLSRDLWLLLSVVIHDISCLAS